MATTMYERPRVETLRASEIVEMLGPVQGYSGIGGERQNFDTALPGHSQGSTLGR
jgi:hypothetical protein